MADRSKYKNGIGFLIFGIILSAIGVALGELAMLGAGIALMVVYAYGVLKPEKNKASDQA